MSALDTTIQKSVTFFQRNKITYFLKVINPNEALIEFDLPIQSFIKPDTLGKTFCFKILLGEERSGGISIIIKTKCNLNVPFHPNFWIKYERFFYRNPYAVWIGYDKDDNGIDQHLKRMILSLQYNPNFIITKDERNIGNKKALNWYLKKNQPNNSIFPTDTFLTKSFHINEAHPEEKKRFEIKSSDTPVKKKFEIRQEKLFKPTLKRTPSFVLDSSLSSLATNNIESPATLYISVLAKKQIFQHICWGQHGIEETMREQGGLLLGQVYYDEELNSYFGIVEQGIPAKSAEGTPTYLQMNHRSWSEMIAKIDILQDEQKDRELQIIGWYHTHPNELSVFMSSTDLNTQQRYFNQSWHFAIVLNPHKQIWKAFSGKDAKECRGFILDDDQKPIDIKQSANNEIVGLNKSEPVVALSKINIYSKYIFLATIAIFFAIFLIWTSKNKNAVRAIPPKSAIKIQEVKQNKSEKDSNNSALYKKEKLNRGTVLYDNNFRAVFKSPLTMSLEILSVRINDSLSKIEMPLYAYRDVVAFTRDSALKTFENLRNIPSANKSSLVGMLADTLFVSKGNYSFEGNWYKIKFSGVIKQ